MVTPLGKESFLSDASVPGLVWSGTQYEYVNMGEANAALQSQCICSPLRKIGFTFGYLSNSFEFLIVY